MVDTSPLLASLLLGQRLRKDPLEQQRTYGQHLIVQGGSTAPLGSGNALEGLARALQAGIGGYVAADANRREDEKGRQSVEALGRIAGATNREELTAAIKGSQIDPDLAGPLMAQILQGKQAQFDRNTASDTFAKAYGGGTTAGPGTGGTAITITPRPGAALPGQDPYQAQTSVRESGGNPQAVNPQSGAFGLYQFMPQTAADVRAANPQLNLPEDHRTWTPDQQNAAEQALRGMNNKRLTELGIPVTPATLALAHAAGADGTAKLLSTPPNTPMEQAVPPIWIEQNPQMRGKTVGQYVQQFASFNQGGAPPAGTPNPQAQGGPDPQVAQVQTPSALSQPPEVPRPQPTPEQINRYRSMVNAPNGITSEQAIQALNKEITDQWQADKARALAIWQDQQQSKRIKEQGEQRIQQEAPMTLLKDRVTNYETKIRPGAMAAVNDIASINQTRQVLDAGAFTGTGAEAKTLVAKVGEQLGIPSEQAQNTQVLGATLAKRVLAGAGGTLGTGFSNADRDFMEKAQGGQLSMDEGALRRILDIGEKQARQTLKNHDVEAARVMKLPGVSALGVEQFQVPTAPNYEEFNKANPLAPLQTGPATPQAAPKAQSGYSEGQTATNPQTGEKLIFQGGKWSKVGG